MGMERLEWPRQANVDGLCYICGNLNKLVTSEGFAVLRWLGLTPVCCCDQPLWYQERVGLDRLQQQLRNGFEAKWVAAVTVDRLQ